MGCYVDVALPYTKEEWLLRNGKLVTKPVWSEAPEGQMFVCMVDNGPFRAAGVAYSEREFDTFSDKSDPRPSVWFLVSTDKLIEVSPLEQYIKEGHVAERLRKE